jgi:hypothetical protein
LARVRAELSEFRAKNFPSLSNKGNLEFLNEVLDGENSQEMEYLGNVTLEALRF